MNPEPETRDDQGLTPDATAVAKELAENHWFGFTGPYGQRLMIMACPVDDSGNIQLDEIGFWEFLQDFHKRVAIHFFKHGIEWERDRLRKEPPERESLLSGFRLFRSEKRSEA